MIKKIQLFLLLSCTALLLTACFGWNPAACFARSDCSSPSGTLGDMQTRPENPSHATVFIYANNVHDLERDEIAPVDLGGVLIRLGDIEGDAPSNTAAALRKQNMQSGKVYGGYKFRPQEAAWWQEAWTSRSYGWGDPEQIAGIAPPPGRYKMTVMEYWEASNIRAELFNAHSLKEFEADKAEREKRQAERGSGSGVDKPVLMNGNKGMEAVVKKWPYQLVIVTPEITFEVHKEEWTFIRAHFVQDDVKKELRVSLEVRSKAQAKEDLKKSFKFKANAEYFAPREKRKASWEEPSNH